MRSLLVPLAVALLALGGCAPDEGIHGTEEADALTTADGSSLDATLDGTPPQDTATADTDTATADADTLTPDADTNVTPDMSDPADAPPQDLGPDAPAADADTTLVPDTSDPADAPLQDLGPQDTLADADTALAPDVPAPDVPAPDVVFVPCTPDPSCNDSVGCTVDACVAGVCTHSPKNAVCDDTNPCTVDTCDLTAGCTHITPPSPCDDGNPCTDDFCYGDVGCKYLPVAKVTVCDDGQQCTSGDKCSGGVCKGQAVVCAPDANPCTTAQCVVGQGCIQTASAGPCDDKDPCTSADTCTAGACAGTLGAACNDNDACTDDACTKGTGCTHTFAAVCVDADACTEDSCTLATGCAHKLLFAAAACDDGNPCTINDYCTTGPGNVLVCAPGTAPTCDDSNACTDDSCVAGVGCQHVPNGAPCNDFDPCTGPDLCAGDYCVGGLAKLCADDGNPCTVEYCISMAPPGLSNSPAADPDGCIHHPLPATCEDGNPCTSGDGCTGTTCAGGSGNGCDDKNTCTLDACAGGGAGCTHTATGSSAACDDGNACTLGDTCNPSTGACAAASVADCDDEDLCTSDACDPVLGCSHPDACDDANPCTEDDCTDTGCSHLALAVFQDNFSAGNAKGWTLDAEWEVGPAKPGACGNLPPGDPAVDHSAGTDNQVAGVVIGGIAKRETHGFRYLTSPEMDTTVLSAPTLEFWRWLQADMAPYMLSTVEAWDGASWQVLWVPEEEEWLQDSAWTRVALDVSDFSNPKFRFRVGFAVPDGDTVLAVGSWTIDDVTVGEGSVCVADPL